MDIPIMRHIFYILLTLILIGCSTHSDTASDKTIYVTIAPLRAIVEDVSCHDFDVEILVPKGAGPETFEPTAKQLTAMSNADVVFTTGLITFEHNLTENIPAERIVDLSRGVELIKGSCSHGHHHHAHGIDPHIWTSPRALKTMTLNICDALMERYPDSTKYITAAEGVIARLDTLDAYCKRSIEQSETKSVMIYHPAYTYYAHDYHIDQIAIEHDGKEPTPKRLKSLIATAQRLGIGHILLQAQYSEDKVRSLARECNAEIIVVDPLAEDIIAEIERVTNIICGK